MHTIKPCKKADLSSQDLPPQHNLLIYWFGIELNLLTLLNRSPLTCSECCLSSCDFLRALIQLPSLNSPSLTFVTPSRKIVVTLKVEHGALKRDFRAHNQLTS